MNLEARIDAFTRLGKLFNKNFCRKHEQMIGQAVIKNPWFTAGNIVDMLHFWGEHLTYEMLSSWIKPYKLPSSNEIKNVLVIMAGNIPLVGFHDFLSVLISGNKVFIKMSIKDNVILPIIVDELISIDPKFRDRISFVDKIVESDQFTGVIATGNDNSSHYFEYYFRSSSNIIRKNRRSVAILDGSEGESESGWTFQTQFDFEYKPVAEFKASF